MARSRWYQKSRKSGNDYDDLRRRPTPSAATILATFEDDEIAADNSDDEELDFGSPDLPPLRFYLSERTTAEFYNRAAFGNDNWTYERMCLTGPQVYPIYKFLKAA